MRVMPLAIWAAEIEDHHMHRKLIKSETELTHFNELAHDAAFVYCRAIAFLLKNSTDDDKFKKCFDYC